MTMDFALARQHMVDSQLRTNKVVREDVLLAFETIKRELFLPQGQRARAYADGEILIAPGRVMMQPLALGRLIQALEPAMDEPTLVVGAGTGYAAALLSTIVGDVIAVEEDQALINAGESALAAAHVKRVRFINAPAAIGDKAHAPYAAILVDGAVASPPRELFSQLAEGGKLAAIFMRDGLGKATLWQKNRGAIAGTVICDIGASFVPGFEPQQHFVF